MRGGAEIIEQLANEGLIDRSEFGEAPFDFLMEEGGAASVVDGAYRYCRHTDGAHVILTGTGKINHLQQNVASISAPPLRATAQEKNLCSFWRYRQCLLQLALVLIV